MKFAVLATLSWHSGRGGGARLWETVLWWWYVGFEAFEAWMYDEFDNVCTIFGAANPVFPLALRNGVIASRLFVSMPLWGMHFALGTFNRLSGILMRQDSHSFLFSGCLFASWYLRISNHRVLGGAVIYQVNDLVIVLTGHWHFFRCVLSRLKGHAWDPCSSLGWETSKAKSYQLLLGQSLFSLPVSGRRG